MKTLIAVAAMTLLCISSASSAKATYVAGDNSPETRLCVNAAMSSAGKMRYEIRRYRQPSTMTSKMRMVANEIYCNGDNIVSFAYNAGNEDVGQFLGKYRKYSVTIKDIAKFEPKNEGLELSILGSH